MAILEAGGDHQYAGTGLARHEGHMTPEKI
jgi:hypothetical protein